MPKTAFSAYISDTYKGSIRFRGCSFGVEKERNKPYTIGRTKIHWILTIEDWGKKMRERKTGRRRAAAGIYLVGMMLMGIGLLFAGCASKDGGQAPGASAAGADGPAWERYAGEPVTFDWYINYSWYNSEWGGNVVSDKITEETGVNIHFITPGGNEKEKLNALIAADSLPDFITLGWWEPQIDEMIDSGMVYALNELAD